MNIKKEIRKMDGPVSIGYNKSEKSFVVSHGETTTVNKSLKKALNLLNHPVVDKVKKEKPKSKKESIGNRIVKAKDIPLTKKTRSKKS